MDPKPRFKTNPVEVGILFSLLVVLGIAVNMTVGFSNAVQAKVVGAANALVALPVERGAFSLPNRSLASEGRIPTATKKRVTLQLGCGEQQEFRVSADQVKIQGEHCAGGKVTAIDEVSGRIGEVFPRSEGGFVTSYFKSGHLLSLEHYEPSGNLKLVQTVRIKNQGI